MTPRRRSQRIHVRTAAILRATELGACCARARRASRAAGTRRSRGTSPAACRARARGRTRASPREVARRTPSPCAARRAARPRGSAKNAASASSSVTARRYHAAARAGQVRARAGAVARSPAATLSAAVVRAVLAASRRARSRDLWRAARRREHSTPARGRLVGRPSASSAGARRSSASTCGSRWAAATVLRLNRLWAFLGSRVSIAPLSCGSRSARSSWRHRLRTGAWVPHRAADVLVARAELFGDWLVGTRASSAARLAALARPRRLRAARGGAAARATSRRARPAHLFHRLRNPRRQHLRLRRRDQDVVLDADADAAPLRGHRRRRPARCRSPARPSAPCPASSGRGLPSTKYAPDVVHVHAQPVAGPVHEEALVTLPSR